MKFCRRRFSAEPQNVFLWYYRLVQMSSFLARMKMLGPKWIVESLLWDNDSRKSKNFSGKIFLRNGERKLETDRSCTVAKFLGLLPGGG